MHSLNTMYCKSLLMTRFAKVWSFWRNIKSSMATWQQETFFYTKISPSLKWRTLVCLGHCIHRSRTSQLCLLDFQSGKLYIQGINTLRIKIQVSKLRIKCTILDLTLGNELVTHSDSCLLISKYPYIKGGWHLKS